MNNGFTLGNVLKGAGGNLLLGACTAIGYCAVVIGAQLIMKKIDEKSSKTEEQAAA